MDKSAKNSVVRHTTCNVKLFPKTSWGRLREFNDILKIATQPTHDVEPTSKISLYIVATWNNLFKNVETTLVIRRQLRDLDSTSIQRQFSTNKKLL